jgi:patatin-like phospholipase/acyl hydrolase
MYFRILSVDGGGVKGLIASEIISAIETHRPGLLKSSTALQEVAVVLSYPRCMHQDISQTRFLNCFAKTWTKYFLCLGSVDS